MGVINLRRTQARLEHTQLRLRIVFLVLSAITVAAGLLLAVIIFFHLLSFALNPGNLQSLVEDWAELMIEKTRDLDSLVSPTEGPARWFAIVVLLVLGFLISRIPLLLIQMGILLFNASQDHQRHSKALLKEVLMELRSTPSLPIDTPQASMEQPLKSPQDTESASEIPQIQAGSD